MDLIIRKFDREKEITIQRSLFKECFPETKGTPIERVDHYLWKFHSKNSHISSSEYVAYIGEDMVGYYAAIPYEYLIDGKLFTAAMVCDVMTGIKARGKGVFTKLGVHSTKMFEKEGFNFSTGFPIRKEVLPGHIKAGWDVLFNLPLYGRFIKLNSFLRGKKISFLVIPFNLILNFFNGINRILLLNISKKNINIEYFTSNDINKINNLKDILDKWNKNNIQIKLKKDIDFIKWRLGAPDKLYHIGLIKENKDPIGYCIFREVEKEGVPCVGILDFYVVNEKKNKSVLLQEFIIKISKKLEAELVLIMLSHIQYKDYKFRKTGFLKTPFKFSFISKLFDSGIDKNLFYNQKSWHLMWIDSDDL